MSVLKLFILSAITCFLSLVCQTFVEMPTKIDKYVSSSKLANQDKAYEFTVPEDGQMMRFDIAGTMPMNSWKSVEVEFYDSEDHYLFTYQDELWAENGRDSDGAWTEYQKYTFFSQRFPKSGNYYAYISDSSGPGRRAEKSQYKIRALPIRGDATFLNTLKWATGFVAFACLMILGHRREQAKEGRRRYRPNRKRPKSKQEQKQENIQFAGFAGLFFLPVLAGCVFAYQDDDDIDWLQVSYMNRQISVDRDLRQQSLSGANFRTRGAISGK